MWYGEPYFQSETINGTFRHKNCKRFASFGTFVNGMCSACNSIPKIDSFRLKLQRRSDSRGDSNETDTSKTNFTYLPRDQLLLKLRETKEQLECCRSQVFLLSSTLARVKQRAHSLKDKVKEFSRRDDINCQSVQRRKTKRKGRASEHFGYNFPKPLQKEERKKIQRYFKRLLRGLVDDGRAPFV